MNNKKMLHNMQIMYISSLITLFVYSCIRYYQDDPYRILGNGLGATAIGVIFWFFPVWFVLILALCITKLVANKIKDAIIPKHLAYIAITASLLTGFLIYSALIFYATYLKYRI